MIESFEQPGANQPPAEKEPTLTEKFDNIITVMVSDIESEMEALYSEDGEELSERDEKRRSVLSTEIDELKNAVETVKRKLKKQNENSTAEFTHPTFRILKKEILDQGGFYAQSDSLLDRIEKYSK